MRPRLLLADDHTLLLEGIRLMLEPEFELVGSVEDGLSLLAMAKTLKPDIILLDISMPALNGIDAARRLRKLLPSAKLIFLTMHADSDYVAEAFRAGAMGYLLKRAAASELIASQRVRKSFTSLGNKSGAACSSVAGAAATLPAGANRANESIPNPHRRAKTTPQ